MEESTAGKTRVSVASWFGVVIVAASLLFLNFDGYHNELPLLHDFNREPLTIQWTHGWPWHFMIRPTIYLHSLGISAPTPARINWKFDNEIGISSRWPFDGIPISYFFPRPLAADIAFFLVICVGTTFGMRQLPHRFQFRVRFGMKFLLGVMTLVAVTLALGLHSYLPRQVPQLAAMAIIGLASMLTLYAAIIFLISRVVAAET